MYNSKKEEKWFWMMKWCRKHHRAPANPIFWNEAERAYEEYLRKNGDRK